MPWCLLLCMSLKVSLVICKQCVLILDSYSEMVHGTRKVLGTFLHRGRACGTSDAGMHATAGAVRDACESMHAANSPVLHCRD